MDRTHSKDETVLTIESLMEAIDKIPKRNPGEIPVMIYMNEDSVACFSDIETKWDLYCWMYGTPVKFSKSIPYGTAVMEMEDKTLRIFMAE